MPFNDMLKKQENKGIDHAQGGYLKGISISCVILCFDCGILKALLLKAGDQHWFLPAGFILNAESIDDAAERIIIAHTGLRQLYLQQFHVFDAWENLGDILSLKTTNDLLSTDRILDSRVSVSYYSLVDIFNVIIPNQDDITYQWTDLNRLPSLHLIHAKILEKAIETLRLHLNFYPVGIHLMPKEFTMPELHKLYESILNRNLDRRNFYQRMISLGVLVRSGEIRKGRAHKAPYVYSFCR